MPDDNNNWHPEHSLSTTSLEQQEDYTESQGLLGEDEGVANFQLVEQDPRLVSSQVYLIRGLALLCACSLSIGSH